MARVRKAFLLAAGLGTRLRPITDTIPKCMAPINGRPLCDYWFGLCEHHGIEDICMNTHYLPEPVREYVASMNRKVRVHLVHEEALVGSAGTVRNNADFIDDGNPFFVIYADNLSNANLSGMAAFHTEHDAPMTMGVFRTPYPKQCGIATVDADGRVTEFIEKPENPKSDLANAGLYVAEASTIADIPDAPVVDYGHDILPRYIGNMYAYTIDGYHLDVGNLESYEKAKETCPPDMV